MWDGEFGVGDDDEVFRVAEEFLQAVMPGFVRMVVDGLDHAEVFFGVMGVGCRFAYDRLEGPGVEERVARFAELVIGRFEEAAGGLG